MNLAENGGHIVSSASLYGGTYNLLHYTLPKLGIEVSFVDDPDDLDAWQRAVRDNTKAFFAETIGNPKGDVLDFEGVSGIAHEHGIPLVVDNTVATPYLAQPLRHGADIVVHSATKFIGGHGTSIGGIIVDGGTFDYEGSGRFPGFTEPDPSYHGLVFAQLPEPLFPARYVLKARLQYLRDMGPSIAPLNSFLFLQGLETLSLRMERHVANAQQVAEWLEHRDEVSWVSYAGLGVEPMARAAAAVPSQRRRCDPGLRHRRRGRGRSSVHRRAGAVQPSRQRRGRPQPGHPPRVDHPFAAHRGRAAHRPASPPTSCGCVSGWRRSTTSWPTSTPVSVPPRSGDRTTTTGAWSVGDDTGDRHFARVVGGDGLGLEAGGRLGPVDVAYETWGELDACRRQCRARPARPDR